MISSTPETSSLEDLIRLIERHEVSPQTILEAIEFLKSQVQNRESLEEAVLGADAGMWEWKPGTNEMNWSPYLNSMLGYDAAELQASVPAFNAMLHPSDVRPLWEAINAHLNGGTPLHEMEIRLRHKNGSYRWVISRGRAIHDAGGKPVRMAGLHLDITSRKSIEGEALVDSEYAMSSLFLEDVPVTATVHCKRCGSAEVARSRWQIKDRIVAAIMLRPFRCRTCGHRFYRPFWLSTIVD
jgi:PAS domain S-box-containing protein